jgi:diguanylate cyclase (GGDEF)-like protein
MNLKPINIMLVEDNPGDARLIQELLKDVGESMFTLTHVDRVSEGVQHIERNYVDVVILDLGLPDFQGLETLTAINKRAYTMPIIVLSGHDDEALAVTAVQEGAQDYLVKGKVDGNLLWRSIRYSIERKHLEMKLAHIATHDSLTNLPNRFLLNDRINVAIAQAKRKKQKLAVMMLDLDFFKNVNDLLGHRAGDKLLIETATRLRGTLRECDGVARLGGDEFILLITELSGKEEAADVAKRVLALLKEPFIVWDKKIDITASIGIALYPDEGKDGDELMKNADNAMYLVKNRGRGDFAFLE